MVRFRVGNIYEKDDNLKNVMRVNEALTLFFFTDCSNIFFFFQNFDFLKIVARAILPRNVMQIY